MRINKVPLLAFLVSSLTACSSFDQKNDPETLALCVDRNKYQAAAQEYYEVSSLDSEKLPVAWPEWVNDNYDRFCKAFDLTQYSIQNKGKSLSLGIFYDQNRPILYENPWPSEEEHMKDLEALLEFTFPSWDFKITFEGEESAEKMQAHDFAVYLNATVNLQTGHSIFLHHEAALAHEVAHEMGLKHHYDTLSDAQQGTNLAPGEINCLMDVTSYQLGSPDRFALDIPFDLDYGTEINMIRKKIASHY